MEMHGRLGTLVSFEKIRTFGFKKLFGFPCGFSLGVIAPLNLIKIAGLIPSNPSLEINNFYWLLRIDKIGLQLQFLDVNPLFWNTEALPELGDMENIMNRG